MVFPPSQLLGGRKEIKVLIADDEEGMRSLLNDQLRRVNCHVVSVENGPKAIGLSKKYDFDVALVDLKMPGMDGIEVLRQLKASDNPMEVIVLTGYASVDTAIEAMRLGAYHYLTKPYNMSELEMVVLNAYEKKTLKEKNIALQEELRIKQMAPRVVAVSAAMKEVLSMVDQVAKTNFPVLIEGESGTGKELVAKAIHQNSARSKNPFIAINCAALQESLVENELFGHSKGAFTGAITRKRGLLEIANWGTLFIDEIADLNFPSQSKLLRVLDSGEFIPLGDTRIRKVDIRVVTATNKELLAEVEAAKFRKDLFYRVNVVNIRIPPLRDRKEDIPPLVDHFLKNSHYRLARDKTVEDEAMNTFMNYNWPGNVRELANVIERSIILSRSDKIMVDDLPASIKNLPSGQLESNGDMTLQCAEKKHLQRILAHTGGNKVATARLLGISRRKLYRMLEKHGFKGRSQEYKYK